MRERDGRSGKRGAKHRHTKQGWRERERDPLTLLVETGTEATGSGSGRVAVVVDPGHVTTCDILSGGSHHKPVVEQRVWVRVRMFTRHPSLKKMKGALCIQQQQQI